MKTIIILVIVFVLFFSFRKKITLFITKLILKNKKNNIKEVDKDLIYIPVLSSRTFYFGIEITELGDGKATLSIAKMKE